ncbi:uncharacterized protein [Arachis hypogaea]|uniref:uncharacterized protein n=1 Tax=Arachis hypogaea TaxID=3818 RepID=UPI000DEC2002|nr:uncharacterized protein LOC112756968 [Arachis hypogaea]
MATIAEVLSQLTLSPSNNHNTPQASTSSGLPSQPQPNSKGSINSITLRSGTKLDEIGLKPTSISKETHNEKIEEEIELNGREKEDVAREEEDPLKVKEPKRKNPLEEPIPIPFLSVAKKAKKHEDFDLNVVEIFKNVEVIVPLFQAIQQVPKYAKFLKDVCTHKEKIGELGKSPVNDSISSLILKKYSDPSPYLVTCVIGGMKFMDCMCDLGACVSIMPLPIYEKLNLSPLKWSGARFVLVDKSIMLVVGIAENMLVNIQELLFLVDFHILETPPIDSDNPSSILFGRPFLKTSRFKLDAFSGAYSFEVEGKVVKFTLDGAKKPLHEVYSIFRCDLIEEKMIEFNVGQEEEKVVKEPKLLEHTQAKHAKELEIFLLGEASSSDH